MLSRHLLFLVAICLSINSFSQHFWENKNTNELVATIQLFPFTGQNQQELKPPIVEVSQASSLQLQFDLLMQEFEYLRFKIIHCDADWTQSVLNDIDFTYQYNNYEIEDFDYSIGTNQLFVHYWCRMPQLKISGNYVVKVFRGNDEKDLLFTRRFILYEHKVGVEAEVLNARSVAKRNTHHRLDFNLNYGLMKVDHPMNEFKVVIRQNQRWDNAITNLQPTYVRKGLLEYRYFNEETSFWAGNQFRFFDLRTKHFNGINVAHINKDTSPIRAFLATGARRRNYIQQTDMNGNFFVQTLDVNGNSIFNADYLNVYFTLKSQKIKEDIYVLGGFNNWQRNANSKMTYDASKGIYHNDALLKQGYYEFVFWVDGSEPYLFDGSHFQSSNDYEIIVYHRSFVDLSDRVVAYKVLQSPF